MGASLRAVLRSGILVLVGLAFGATFVLLGIAGVTLRSQCPAGDWTLGGCVPAVDLVTTSAIEQRVVVPGPEPKPAKPLSGRELALRSAGAWIAESFEVLALLDEEQASDALVAARFAPVAEIPGPATAEAKAPTAVARRTVATVDVDGNGQPVWPASPSAAAKAVAETTAPDWIPAEVPDAPVAAYVPVPQVIPASLRAAVETAPAAGGEDGTRTVLGQGANVRSGPSSSDGALFALAGGETVTVSGEERGWLRVTDDRGRTGWIYSRYLSGG